MNAKDIELLFEEELGIDEVCVYSYDERTKLLNMVCTIDFRLDNGNDTKFSNYIGYKLGNDDYMTIFNALFDEDLSTMAIDVVNNKVNIATPTQFEKDLKELLQRFFDKFLSEFDII